MRFSPLVNRIGGPSVAAWDIHFAAAEAKRRGEDVILLSVGDPDFATPEAVTDAAVAALRAGDTHYSEIPGRRPLRQAIAAMLSRTCGPLTADNVIIAAGAQNALFCASLCLFCAGDEIVVLEPMYLTYPAALSLAGALLVRVPMPAERGFRPDAAAIEAAVTARTRAIVLTTPNNPTGVVLTRAELEAIADVARRHDLVVVVDEVYALLVFEGEHVSMASLPGMAERTVTIGSLSKSHAMTGWRLGWLAGPEALVRHVETLAIAMVYGLPGFVQEAALVALADGAPTAAAMTERYRRRRDVVVAALADTPCIAVLSPAAGMFVLVDVRATGLSGHAFAWALFRATGVATIDATAFGPPAEGFLRLAFTVGEDVLLEACRRIDGFVRALPAAVHMRRAG